LNFETTEETEEAGECTGDENAHEIGECGAEVTEEQ
jgi:hypothetical protein